MSLFASWLKAGGKTFFLFLPFSCTLRKWTNWIFLHDDKAEKYVWPVLSSAATVVNFLLGASTSPSWWCLVIRHQYQQESSSMGCDRPYKILMEIYSTIVEMFQPAPKQRADGREHFPHSAALPVWLKKKNTACLCRKLRNTKVYHCGAVNCTEKTDKRQTLIWAAFNLSCDWCEFIGGGV